MIKVVAKFSIKSDKIEEFKSVALQLINPTRAEEGCITYELCQDQKDETTFFFIEEWESKDLLNVHLKSPHIKELGPKMKPAYAKEMELNILDLVK